MRTASGFTPRGRSFHPGPLPSSRAVRSAPCGRGVARTGPERKERGEPDRLAPFCHVRTRRAWARFFAVEERLDYSGEPMEEQAFFELHSLFISEHSAFMVAHSSFDIAHSLAQSLAASTSPVLELWAQPEMKSAVQATREKAIRDLRMGRDLSDCFRVGPVDPARTATGSSEDWNRTRR